MLRSPHRLLSEPWMFPKEWVQKMGGESCDDCSKCAASELSTWFAQKDVDDIAAAGLNTVRIPIGYWIIEDLPKGGLEFLKNGLRMLKEKGIHVMLDFHAMPGVSSANQMFAGRCTSDVRFYTDKNYERALTWAAVMTEMVYRDPDFSTVFAIEAINEPIMDASKTPGYGNYQKRFVEAVRSVESKFGVSCPGVDRGRIVSDPLSLAADKVVVRVLEKAISILNKTADKPGLELLYPSTHINSTLNLGGVEISAIRQGHGAGRLPLPMSAVTQSIPVKRSIDDHISRNPTAAANGPQLYDAHLYFSFGGVADPNPDSYMRTICNTDRVKNAYADNNNPLVFGEWSLATNFDASEDFIRDWADAQRYIYAGQADGWIFWSHKIEQGSPYIPYWSYFSALKAGYLRRIRVDLLIPMYASHGLRTGLRLRFKDVVVLLIVPLAYTPMINSKMFAGNHRRGYQELNFNIANGEEGGDRDRPLIVQLLDSALVVQDHCDAVDINFGCPQDIAKKGHYGSFLQDDWDLVYKLSKLIAGLADWTQIAAVKKALKIPVFANGNILYPEDVKACLEATGADGVMSAEANLYNPALFAGLPPDSPLVTGPRDHTDLAIEYLEIVKELKTDTAPSAVKGHLFKLMRPALGRETDLRDRIGRVNPKGPSKSKDYKKSRAWVDEYLEIVKELKTRMERDKAAAADSGDLAKEGLPLPHWSAQPYVRPPPVLASNGKQEKGKAKKGKLAANLPPPDVGCPAEDAEKLEKAEAEVAVKSALESGVKRAATPTEVAALEAKRPRLEDEPLKVADEDAQLFLSDILFYFIFPAGVFFIVQSHS
ncbi:Cellulase (glycosyl hydrolase family 5) [Rhizoctonia solani]|uniref:Cellulase (Glycosyl hydrolase family 5) n=1 Tax=Rhizoctonia solani TaxID=456999 RepID=A0A8H7I586_9AGAM|nr:Cellulase (glycosyl hydrolase family 5) [Rhizoctonia solani]